MPCSSTPESHLSLPISDLDDVAFCTPDGIGLLSIMLVFEAQSLGFHLTACTFPVYA